jgi:hypothetical protein
MICITGRYQKRTKQVATGGGYGRGGKRIAGPAPGASVAGDDTTVLMAIYQNRTIVPGRHVSITSAALARATSPGRHVLHSRPRDAISHFALCDHTFEIPEQSNSWRSDTFWKPAAGMSSACRCEHSQLPIRILRCMQTVKNVRPPGIEPGTI